MNWTTEKPTEPGFYLVGSVVCGEVEVEFAEIYAPWGERLIAKTGRYSCRPECFDQYYGPIPMPTKGKLCEVD